MTFRMQKPAHKKTSHGIKQLHRIRKCELSKVLNPIHDLYIEAPD